MFFSYIFTYVCVYVCTQAYKARAAGQARDFNMQATSNTGTQDGDLKEGLGERGKENVNTREADSPGIACARELELYVPE